ISVKSFHHGADLTHRDRLAGNGGMGRMIGEQDRGDQPGFMAQRFQDDPGRGAAHMAVGDLAGKDQDIGHHRELPGSAAVAASFLQL
ncbi:MAG: hypothetical protein D6773_02860, partial [Alphaproteobacteria bacterium]